MRKTRRARCSIGFIIRDGRIRTCDLNFHPIVKLGVFPIVIQFTPFSTALKHQPPFFGTTAILCLPSFLPFLSFHLPQTIPSNYFRHLETLYLLIPPRWSRLIFAAILVGSTTFTLYRIKIHRIITIVFVRSDSAQDRISISTSY